MTPKEKEEWEHYKSKADFRKNHGGQGPIFTDYESQRVKFLEKKSFDEEK